MPAGAIMLFSTTFHQRTGGLKLQGTSLLKSSPNDTPPRCPDGEGLKVRHEVSASSAHVRVSQQTDYALFDADDINVYGNLQ